MRARVCQPTSGLTSTCPQTELNDCTASLGVTCGEHVESPSSYFTFYTEITIMEIKSRRLRWPGHVARMEEGRSAFKILTGMSAEKRPLERPSVDGRTIFEWILKK